MRGVTSVQSPAVIPLPKGIQATPSMLAKKSYRCGPVTIRNQTGPTTSRSSSQVMVSISKRHLRNPTVSRSPFRLTKTS